MALAVATGVAPDVWAKEGARAIATAYELLEKGSRPAREALGYDGDEPPQMSG